MNYASDCPVCRNVDGGSCKSLPNSRRTHAFECSMCGRFEANPQAFNWLIAVKDEHGEPRNLQEITRNQRALISYKMRTTERNELPFIISEDWIEHLISEIGLPSPILQAVNLISFIGDAVRRSGDDLVVLPENIHAIIGAPGRQSAINLAIELGQRGILRLSPKGATDTIGDSLREISIPTEINLTLDGWQQYEDEKRGHFVGNYGFIAMEFGNHILDSLVHKTIKPAIKREIGYDLVDMRDVARAGVIDNIMRTQIRDSAFVIVDLTHDNLGAYWEAGYAEGLGKPVIYICDKEKFDEDSTHFDTNHCTTVFWSKGDPEEFRQELIATLRRSLDRQ